ncbi:NAD(P)H-hydrate dehydratase [Schwartzia sp. (in: firmicutes)]
MKIALSDEMRQMDKLAAEKYHIPPSILMENAGRAVMGVVGDIMEGFESKTVSVFAGSGNNGGDAFAAARHLSNHGTRVAVFCIGNTEHLSDEAAKNLEICRALEIPVYEMKTEHDWDKLKLWLKLSDAAVDGLLGTGFSGKLNETYEKIINMMNEAGMPIVSIDIPSGVNADTGEAETAVSAAVTVTFGLPKAGHFFCPGEAFTGRLVVDDISMPPPLLNDKGIMQEYLDDNLAKAIIPARPLDAYKGSCGRVLVVAGSRGMTGAAAMASEAVLRAGGGISILATANSLTAVLAMKLTEVMVRALPELRPGVLGDDALEPLKKLAADSDAVLIGPGLGRDPQTSHMIREFVKTAGKPTIIDADGLFAWQGYTQELKGIANPVILTPHLGEMAGLLGIKVSELRQNLLQICRKAASDWGTVLVVKSECTIVVYPDGRIYFTSKGNAGMATAGSGDVLAGTIAGLMEEASSENAPLLGVYLHGAAGDMAAEENGDGLLAGDILRNIPKARKN